MTKMPKKSSGVDWKIMRPEFYASVAEILRKARTSSYRAVNFIMVEAYWNVGRVIVEEEQQGSDRAKYGSQLIKRLASRLSNEFGETVSERNLRNFRQLFLCFPIWNAVRSESSIPPTSASSEIHYALRSELTWTPLPRPDAGGKSRCSQVVHEGGRRAELEHPRP